MCFNQQVSIATYLIGMIGSWKLLNRGFIITAVFFAWVIQMQLIEFILWRNQTCLETNKRVTRLGILFNHLQPIVLWICILYFSNMKLPLLLNVFMIAFVIFTIHYTYGAYVRAKCTTVSKESSPHLHWRWNESRNNKEYYASFLLALVLLFTYGVPDGQEVAIITIVSYAISYYVYQDNHSVGAMWCFAAAFAPWIINYSRAS